MEPFAAGDGFDCFGEIDEIVPCLAASGYDVVVGFIGAVGEGVLPEILPDVFLWVQLRALGGADIGGSFEGFCGVPASPVNNDDGMRTLLDLAADFDEMLVHGMGVGEGHDQRRAHAACRTDSSKDIGTFITLVAHGARTGAFLAPDIGERPFLPYAGFVLHPDFEVLADGMFGEDFGDPGGEFF